MLDTRTEITTDRRTIAESVFRLKGKQFSLANYPPFHAIYSLNANRTLVMSGRQVSKSTSVSTFGVSEAIGMPFWESLTLQPSLTQIRRYSVQRVAALINESPDIKRWFVDKNCRKNVHERSFANGSIMYFGATSQMESLRGLSANRVFEDEIQDMVGEELDIIEEVLSGQPSDKQFIMRTGTAKTVGNILESTWRKSTQNEWIVICPAGHHNLPSTENIGDKGFICKACKSLCDVRIGKWMSTGQKDATWLGFRVPQIILPMHTEDAGKWSKLLEKYHGGREPNTFLNEVMGHSAGSGITLLSEDDLRACCADYEMTDCYDPSIERYHSIFACIDWGLTARRSFTVVSFFGIDDGPIMRLLRAVRFHEPDVIKQVDSIAKMCVEFAVDHIGADWGAGVAQSRLLEEKLRRPVHRFMYVGEQHELVQWSKKNEVWTLNRTQAMMETFVKMRKQLFRFPVWEQFRHYAEDILCIYEEPLDDRNNNDKMKFDHSEDTPDDFAHTCVYANLLLFLVEHGKI